MHEGRIVGELPRGSSEAEVMRLSVGLGANANDAVPEQVQ